MSGFDPGGLRPDFRDTLDESAPPGSKLTGLQSVVGRPAIVLY